MAITFIIRIGIKVKLIQEAERTYSSKSETEIKLCNTS